MKTNKGFIGIGMLLAIIIAALAVGGGVTYYAIQKSHKVQENGVVDNSPDTSYQKIPGNENGVIHSDGTAQAVNPEHPEQAHNCTTTSAPSIKVLAPNGGEVFTTGQQITVKWNTCNLLATDQVAIGLMRQGSNGFSYVDNGDTRIYGLQNDGIETITLAPATENAGMVYKIDVDVTRTGQSWDYEDTSDSMFTINP